MAENGTEIERITAKQARSIALLAAGESQESVCESIGISRTTLSRWLVQPAFGECLRTERKRVVTAAFDGMVSIIHKAVKAVRELLDSPIPMVRLRSAELVLKFCRENAEINDLLVRIEKIEQRLNQPN
jgi:hypothetical protein